LTSIMVNSGNRIGPNGIPHNMTANEPMLPAIIRSDKVLSLPIGTIVNITAFYYPDGSYEFSNAKCSLLVLFQ